MITIYTKNNCQACRAMKRHLTKQSLEYKEINIDLSENEKEKQFLIEQGWKSLPVVITSKGESFSGYKPELIFN